MSPEHRPPHANGCTFPKTARLRKRPEFQALQQHGRRFPTRDLIILWQEGRTTATRLGVTVSRRVAKQAVRRNRIKRWIREAYRRLPDRHSRRSLDIVVIARSQALTSTYARIQHQLGQFWTKAENPPPPKRRRPRRRPSGA